MSSVQVRSLMWTRNIRMVSDVYVAKSPLGTFRIQQEGIPGGYTLYIPIAGCSKEIHTSEGKARRAAQEIFEEKVKACLR